MPATRNCPQCGAPLAADAPAGLCPRCLMQAGLASDAGATTVHVPTGQSPLPRTPGSDARPAPAFAPPAPAEIAANFPQLEILELLGHGGMGMVYKARQPQLDRLVALKIMLPGPGRDPAFAERFAREARSLARLNHPNIVSVFDFGQSGGYFYLIMEFVDGVNLRQLLKSRQMAPPEALAIVPKICDALQFAHDEGIVHRDIKPENILIDKKGRVKIADFGLAKLLGKENADFNLTNTGVVMGTPRYMAPEQMEKPQEVDHRADIFSLGVVFYEMLTGELPLGRFASPSQKVQVDVRLDEVVLRTLEKEPDRRYQHASEVKTDVENISGILEKLPPSLRHAFGFEYRSQAKLFGLPLLHIVSGPDPKTGRARTARGILAIGETAKGVFAFGAEAFGLIAVGGFAVGGIVVAGCGIGVLSFSGLALALWCAYGGVALAPVAYGGLAVGYYAAGGYAIGVNAMGGNANSRAAKEFFRNWGFQQFWLLGLGLMAIAIVVEQWATSWAKRRLAEASGAGGTPTPGLGVPAGSKAAASSTPREDLDVNEARSQVEAAALGLFIIGLLNCLALIPALMALAGVSWLAGASLPFGLGGDGSTSLFIWGAFGPVIMFGARKMSRLDSPDFAKFAVVLAMVPITSPLFLVGIPVGIWCLKTLKKPGVKEAFRLAAQASTQSGGRGVPPMPTHGQSATARSAADEAQLRGEPIAHAPSPQAVPIASVASAVGSADDFLVCNPRLPRMAQAITVFALFIAPLFYLVDLFTLEDLPTNNAYAEFIQSCLNLVAGLGGLVFTTVLVIGGIKLRKLSPTGPGLLRAGLWLSLTAILVAVVLAIWSDVLVADGDSKSPAMSMGEAFVSASALMVVAFEITALVWLRRNRQRLADICRLAAGAAPTPVQGGSVEASAPTPTPPDFRQQDAREILAVVMALLSSLSIIGVIAAVIGLARVLIPASRADMPIGLVESLGRDAFGFVIILVLSLMALFLLPKARRQGRDRLARINAMNLVIVGAFLAFACGRHWFGPAVPYWLGGVFSAVAFVCWLLLRGRDVRAAFVTAPTGRRHGTLKILTWAGAGLALAALLAMQFWPRAGSVLIQERPPSFGHATHDARWCSYHIEAPVNHRVDLWIECWKNGRRMNVPELEFKHYFVPARGKRFDGSASLVIWNAGSLAMLKTNQTKWQWGLLGSSVASSRAVVVEDLFAGMTTRDSTHGRQPARRVKPGADVTLITLRGGQTSLPGDPLQDPDAARQADVVVELKARFDTVPPGQLQDGAQSSEREAAASRSDGTAR